jgi:V/A-type H+-transporting ATPase subunit K
VKTRIIVSSTLIGAVGLLALLGSLVLWLPQALAADVLVDAVALAPEVWRWGLASAALATGLSSLGAAYAVATVGSAAMGTLAEKPDLFGRLLIFVGLAEGIAIYGVIVSVLILNKLV